VEFGIARNEASYGGLVNRYSPDVEVIVKTAHDELRRLVQQRTEITKRIGTIKQTIVGLCNLFGDDELKDDLYQLVNGKAAARRSGITQACRRVLMDAGCPLTTRSVCDQIQQRNMLDQSCLKNLVAKVRTVLGRLAQYGEARTVVPHDNGPRTWEWVSEVEAGQGRPGNFAVDFDELGSE
jgi:hypothetical protein